MRPGAEPFADLYRKVVVLITEDWFALSHFRPLIALLKEVAREVVVITRSSGRLGEIEALGARVIDFDYRRSSSNPAREAASAWALARILEAEAPDVVHLVAMKPAVLGGLALKLVPSRHVVVHMTGLGLLGFGTGALLRLYRAAALRLMASTLRRPGSYLLVENEDDLALLRERGVDPGGRFAILGGAGVDPQAFPALPPPANAVPIAAFVGRMIRPKGVDVLMQACDQLEGRGVALELELYGATDADNSEAIGADVLTAWCAQHRARWLGPIADVREVWRRADIFVLPARSREGMPRALLEAAACARPLVVTDVPGCRTFRPRRRRRLHRPAGGCGRAGRCPGTAGARSRAAPAHGRGGAPAPAARLHRGPRQAVVARGLCVAVGKHPGFMTRARPPASAVAR